jgi:hypothetical protein
MPPKKAPRLEDAPLLDPKDFLAFEKHKWHSDEYNAERLQLKRKLQIVGEAIAPLLAAAGGDFTVRTSIHNPYKFNGNKVDSLRFYFAPGDKAKKELRELLGVEFAEDTDASYVHANLVCTLDFTGIRVGLTVHERAWYDTQNVRGLCATREGAERFIAALNGVPPTYALKLHDWQKLYPCGSLKWDDMLAFFRYFEAGKHRITVLRELPKSTSEIYAPGFYASIAAELTTLLPVYRLVLWSTSNNFLGMKR